MSAALVILPQVWATVEASSSPFAEPNVAEPKKPRRLRLVNTLLHHLEEVEETPAAESAWSTPPDIKERGNFAFYRKYTEAMLRRCMKLSMAGGRVASLLGRELFRTNVTHYKVEGFDDSVIADLNVLKSQMDQLMGIGQPGRLHHLERRVSNNEQGVQRMKGFVGAFGAGMTAIHLAINYISGKHH